MRKRLLKKLRWIPHGVRVICNRNIVYTSSNVIPVWSISLAFSAATARQAVGTFSSKRMTRFQARVSHTQRASSQYTPSTAIINESVGVSKNDWVAVLWIRNECTASKWTSMQNTVGKVGNLRNIFRSFKFQLNYEP